MQKIQALRYNQKDKEIYIFSADPNFIKKLVKISDISKNDKNFQRPYDIKRIEEIKTYLLGKDKLYKKGKNIYAKGYIPNSIVINLSNKYKITEENKNIYINFPSAEEAKKFENSIEIIDGQHRLLAFDDECKSKLKNYKMCFVAFTGLTGDEKKEVFMVLNERQKTVDKNILLRQKKLLNLLLDDEEIRYDIIVKLNNDNDSPLKSRIVLAGEKIKYGLKAKQIDEIFEKSKIISTLTDSNGQLSDKKYKLLLNYFNAWKNEYSNIWFSGNNTLTKISGFRFIVFLFSGIYTILNSKRNFQISEFEKIVNEIKKIYFNDNFDIKKADKFQYFQEKSGTIRLAENISKEMCEKYEDKDEDILV